MNMMDITYKRSGNNNYMIMSSFEEAPEHEKRMLENNDIEYLLPFFSVTTEEGEKFWYDINGKKSVKHIMESSNCDRSQLFSLLLAVFDAIDGIGEFLISGQHIIMNEETIYVSPSNENTVYLCYNPDGTSEIKESLRYLLEYIISVMSHDDQVQVDVVYDIYESLCDDSFFLDDARRKIYDKNEISLPQQYQSYAPESPESYETEFEHDRYEADEYSDFGEKLDQIFEDDEEDENFLKNIIVNITTIPSKILAVFVKKKDEYFPPKDLEEDMIYEPGEYIPEPTVMLNEQGSMCLGKLNYDGNGNEKNHTLSGDNIHIGSRDEGNDILLHSNVVSRHHAKISKRGNDYYIEDLNSTNGTYVNGTALEVGQEKILHPMDKIVFADVPYRIV